MAIHKLRMNKALTSADLAEMERILTENAVGAPEGEDGAAESVREGMEETLTVLKLDPPPVLRAFFATTNAIENLMGGIRRLSRNVKRWRSPKMAKRWATAAIARARRSFRRIKGHKNLPVLVANLAALRRNLDAQEQVS